MRLMAIKNEALKNTSFMHALSQGVDGHRIFTSCGDEYLATQSELTKAKIAGVYLEEISDECPCGDILETSVTKHRYFDIETILVMGYFPEEDQLILRTTEQHPFRKRVYSLLKNEAHLLNEDDLSTAAFPSGKLAKNIL